VSLLPERHLVTVDEFDRMVDAGVFAPDRRLELIDGEMVDMSPIGSAHQACVDRLTTLLAPLATSGRALLRVQGSFKASDISQPQPDVALLVPRDDYYAQAHPGPSDVLLVIEVADTSVRFDRDVKLPAYGRAGVAEAWVVDLHGGVVEIATRPSDQGYEHLVRAGRQHNLTPTAFPDVVIAVSDLLG
jgi:Uma2 family endonuclease